MQSLKQKGVTPVGITIVDSVDMTSHKALQKLLQEAGQPVVAPDPEAKTPGGRYTPERLAFILHQRVEKAFHEVWPTQSYTKLPK